MKKILMLVVCLLIMGLGERGFAAVKQLKTAFVVQDYSGEMEPQDYREWRQVTRWAYGFPYYVIVEKGEVEPARKILDVKTVDKQRLAAAAEAVQAQVIVVARIYEMSARVEHFFGSMENGPLARVEIEADLLVYRADTGKFLKDEFRENEVYDLGNHPSPAETIKWRLCDLVNTMEGRELIR